MTVKVIADSIWKGKRLTTLQVRLPKFILAELNTHRLLCLDGDTEISFDLPSGEPFKHYSMPISEIYKKFHVGTDKIIKNMLLRQVNEDSLEIQHTRIKDVFYNGKIKMYKITLKDGKSLTCTSEHKIFTPHGWKTLRDMRLTHTANDTAIDEGNKVIVEGRKLIGHPVEIVSVEYVGVRDSYDLEVEGAYANFIADGVCVHNCKNAGSSRAKPVKTVIEEIRNAPFTPNVFTKNKPGMQGTEIVDSPNLCADIWRKAANNAADTADMLMKLKVHKQTANRVLEPFMWVDVVITATEWDNFLYLRCSKEYGGEGMAQPEFMHVADSIKEALKQHVPTATPNHMPYFTERLSDFDLMTQMLICSARCARVSYKPFNSDTENVEKDEDLAKKLKDSGHMSPFEHCAVYNEAEQFPYQQWKSYRRIMEHAVN